MSETVWDKEGNPHRMSGANARDLVNFAGWSRVAPVVAEATKAVDESFTAAMKAAEKENEARQLAEAQAVAEERARKVAEAAANAAQKASEAASEAAAKADVAETANDPEKMEIDKLRDLATNLGVKVDARWSKTRLLSEIKKASQEG